MAVRAAVKSGNDDAQNLVMQPAGLGAFGLRNNRGQAHLFMPRLPVSLREPLFVHRFMTMGNGK